MNTITMACNSSRTKDAQESSIPCLDGDPQLEARFECPICLQCLKDPVLTTCGHRFCNSCITSWLKGKGGCCPLDSLPLKPESDLFPDNFTRREIQGLDHHTNTCGHQDSTGNLLVECSFKNVGCSAILPTHQLVSHLDQEMHHHLHLLSLAYGKLNDRVGKEHVQLKSQEAATLWDPSNKELSQEESQQKWEGLIHSLYARIVLLEQRNQEQDIQIQNIKQQMFGKLDAISQELTLRYCNGTHIWKVANFSAKLAAMKAEPNSRRFYSSNFYTSPTGYRFCLRMNLSPNDHSSLTLLIHLVQGDNDVFLKWPFVGKITFMLINARDPCGHLSETVMSRPEIAAFKRPTLNMNLCGFGYTEFISVNELYLQGFVYDDELKIKVTVQSV